MDEKPIQKRLASVPFSTNVYKCYRISWLTLGPNFQNPMPTGIQSSMVEKLNHNIISMSITCGRLTIFDGWKELGGSFHSEAKADLWGQDRCPAMIGKRLWITMSYLWSRSARLPVESKNTERPLYHLKTIFFSGGRSMKDLQNTHRCLKHCYWPWPFAFSMATELKFPHPKGRLAGGRAATPRTPGAPPFRNFLAKKKSYLLEITEIIKQGENKCYCLYNLVKFWRNVSTAKSKLFFRWILHMCLPSVASICKK